MKLLHAKIIGLALPCLLPLAGHSAELGTRQQTIIPLNLPLTTPPLAPSNVTQYVSSGYGAWNWGPGANEGRKFLKPTVDTGATNAARLLTFFSMSDIHLTDKESPAQVPYFGWSSPFCYATNPSIFSQSYSPVFLSTTHHLDAAIRTINALHRLAPYDCGIVLGDNCNSSQFNELRWFIDVLDGRWIEPSSGAHLGATNIDYQMPYQAAGLDRSIPWYETIGNHDQMWMGIFNPSTEKLSNTFIGTNVLNMGTNLFAPDSTDGTGEYGGVVDGTTPYGDVIKGGPTNLFAIPPTVVADTNRHSLTTDIATPTNYINEFFNSTTLPVGHGFDRTHTGVLASCYTFQPVPNLPLKVIMFDDTCKSNSFGPVGPFFGDGWVDATRYTWLTNELHAGQINDQLMILACHIPIKPQADIFITNVTPQFYIPFQEPATNYPGCKTEDEIIATLHQYPNLLMVMAGHRHINVVTPFPSPDTNAPECGFWEVETASLRDFPRQFRNWEILRNSDNTISILTTDVDPVVETNSPAWKAISYGVGAGRIFGHCEVTNTYSHTYNAELVKVLTPRMQTVMANVGRPLGHRVAIDCTGSDVTSNFLGELQSANTPLGPWNPAALVSPYTVPITNTACFYRAVEQ
jgi:metallophosphoesterase (TIGR03768 family)